MRKARNRIGPRPRWFEHSVAAVAVLTVTLAGTVRLSTVASADTLTPIACDPGAIQAALAQGGSYQFDCTGTIYTPQNAQGVASPFVVPSGTTVAFTTTGESITLDGLGQTQIFVVQPGASLTLNSITLQNGLATTASGANGGAGVSGSSGATGQPGIDGTPSGAIDGASGQGGTEGTAGSDGLAGADGQGAYGGAIYNAGTLTLNECTLQANTAAGASGGSGGQGGAGGAGGSGGSGGSGATPNATGTGGAGAAGGTGGNGSAGGNGGAGGQGGPGHGGAIYNALTGTATINDSTFTNDTAAGASGGTGGSGGRGGTGGAGGTGGTGATGNTANGGAGGAGGRGASGGAGGTGGAGGAGGGGAGGAIYNDGGTLSIRFSTFRSNTATSGSGGPGGPGGNGATAGQGGQGGDGGDAYLTSPGHYAGPGGDPGANGDGGQSGNGGNGGQAGTGGSAFGGAIYSTDPIQVDGQTIPALTLRTLPIGVTPTSFTADTITGGSTPNGCAANTSGCGGAGGTVLAPYLPVTGGAPERIQGQAGTPTTIGTAGQTAADNTTTVLTGGIDAWIDGNNGLTTTGATRPPGGSTNSPSPGTATIHGGGHGSVTRPDSILRVRESITIVGTRASNPRAHRGLLATKAIQAASNMLERSSGLHPHPYTELVSTSTIVGNGVCAIGYGSTLHSGRCTASDRAQWRGAISRRRAQRLLTAALHTAAGTVARYTYAHLSPSQRVALTLFVYNVGGPAFRGSTLLRDLNAGAQMDAANQLLRWTRTNGLRQPALGKWRKQERALLLSPTARTPAHRASTATPAGDIKAGHVTRISGEGAHPGCMISLTAVAVGVSPYRAIPLPLAVASSNGGYTIHWRIPRSISDTLRWQITGSQHCETYPLRLTSRQRSGRFSPHAE